MMWVLEKVFLHNYSLYKNNVDICNSANDILIPSLMCYHTCYPDTIIDSFKYHIIINLVALSYTGAPIRVIVVLVALDWIHRYSANCSKQDRALDKFTWQALESYWWGLVPCVPHKLDSDRMNMEGRHESVNWQGFIKSFFLPLWLETHCNSRRQSI
jgi:hypothetical protein